MENQSTTHASDLSTELKSVESKFFLLSKTTWGIILMFITGLAQWLGLDVTEASTKATEFIQMLSAMLAVVGVRTATQPLTFKPPFSVPSVPPSVTSLFMVGAICVSTAAVMVLSSCSSAGSYPALGSVTGSVSYRDAVTGAKAGLSFDSETVTPFARVPFFDEAGNVVGVVELGDVMTPVSAK